MDEQNSIPQDVVLTDPGSAVLFAEKEGETVVYYDLDCLLAQYVGVLIEKALTARATGNEALIAECRGASAMLEGIRRSRDALLAERSMKNAANALADAATTVSLADFGIQE